MIYAKDVAHLGGTVSDAAKAVEQIVDVNVDQVYYLVKFSRT